MKENNTRRATGIAAILAYCVSGVLLLMHPQLMTDVTMWALAIVLCAFGVMELISYFRLTPVEGAATHRFASALLALTLGIGVMVDRDLFANFVPRIWGLLLMLGGFVKAQQSVDALRLKSSRWWWLLLGAAVSVVLGFIALTRPAFVRDGIAVYIGVSLIVEAIIDLVMLILIKVQGKKQSEG